MNTTGATATPAADSWIERAVRAKWPVSSAFVLLLLLTWQIAGTIADTPSYLFVPTSIFAAFVEQLTNQLPANTAATVWRQTTGFVLGTTLGTAIGLLAGMSRPVDDLTSPIVSLTYPLPKIALFPVLIVWLGFGDAPRITVVALACFYPALVNAAAGTRGVDRRKIWIAQNFGASRIVMFRNVVLRDAMAMVVVGARISLALSFVVTFSAEAINARDGLGWMIMDGYLNVQYERMYAALVMFGLVGFIADRTLLWASRPLVQGQHLRAVGHG